ncbi:unnamed protein product [Paramecium pentaurelia]|uniref:Transmembrane protein n=1 Tax=Paramecium pentaurelia TaxID=43138 RepID=A0A8S1YFZ7_9CILI|nr:unnamed protein product [Paramecium pentaurelia]
MYFFVSYFGYGYKKVQRHLNFLIIQISVSHIYFKYTIIKGKNQDHQHYLLMKVKHCQKRNIDIQRDYLTNYYQSIEDIRFHLEKLLINITFWYIDSIKSKFIPYNLYLGILLLISFRNKLCGCKIPIEIYIQKLIIQFLKKIKMMLNLVDSKMMLYLIKLLVIIIQIIQLFSSIQLIIKIQFFYCQLNSIVFHSLNQKRVILFQLIIMSQIINYMWTQEHFLLNQVDSSINLQVDVQLKLVVIKMILKIKSQESSMIELREHYWRAYYYSLTIEHCQNWEENYKSGWKPGDESCMIENIGALCEECDLYNSRGSGSYSVTSAYSYRQLTLITTLMSVSSTREMIEEFVKGISLKTFGFRVAIKEVLTAILIKVLISSHHFNYFYLLITSTSRISLSFQYC